MAKRTRRQPAVILIDEDYFTPQEDGETQEACDAALERLLERVRAKWPNAAIICEPEHLWQTYLAMRPGVSGEVTRQVADSWYQDSWECELSAA